MLFSFIAWLGHYIALLSNSDCGSLYHTRVLCQEKEGITFLIKKALVADNVEALQDTGRKVM